MVIDSLNEGFNSGELSFSQRRGIIKLLYKKGAKNNLNNYRPIMLLNYDYKICTAVLALRVQKIIKGIISNDQCGYIKGRFIGQNIRLIENIIDYCDGKNNSVSILFIDFQKAFDSLEMNFLEKCLFKIGFGNSFINWVKTTYKCINSCISISGFLSRSFELQRGIRQGCPLSALLFIIAAEFLSVNIKNNHAIHGFKFNENSQFEIKIVQMANDTSVFTSNMLSVSNVLKEIDKFSSVSGIVMNMQKTEGIWLGNDNQRDLVGEIKWSDEPVKSLGIYFLVRIRNKLKI